jgi:hypothetical protein
MWSIPIAYEEFQRRIAEADALHQSPGDAEWPLQTLATTFEPDEGMQHLDASQRMALVEQVAEMRRQHFTQGRRSIREVPRPGLLIATFPDASLGCDSARAYSGGFYGVDNLPGCDVWITTGTHREAGDCVFSWAPDGTRSCAYDGVVVLPAGFLQSVDIADGLNASDGPVSCFQFLQVPERTWEMVREVSRRTDVRRFVTESLASILDGDAASRFQLMMQADRERSDYLVSLPGLVTDETLIGQLEELCRSRQLRSEVLLSVALNAALRSGPRFLRHWARILRWIRRN